MSTCLLPAAHTQDDRRWGEGRSQEAAGNPDHTPLHSTPRHLFLNEVPLGKPLSQQPCFRLRVPTCPPPHHILGPAGLSSVEARPR